MTIYRGIHRLLAELQEVLPQLENYAEDEQLREENQELLEKNERLMNHIMGQDKIITELREAIRWMAQTQHQGTHTEEGGTYEHCSKVTCQAAAQMLKQPVGVK